MLRFEIRGCQVCISTSFFALITFIMIISTSEIVLISLVSSFLHESGHILSMIILGDKIRQLTFTATGIRLDKSRERALSYNAEITISLAGVLVNFALCAISGFLYCYAECVLFAEIFAVNLIVGVFNLLPVESLDGARALYFVFLKRLSPEKADRVSLFLSLITVIFVIIGTFFLAIYYGLSISLLIATVYLIFLLINHIFELKK